MFDCLLTFSLVACNCLFYLCCVGLLLIYWFGVGFGGVGLLLLVYCLLLCCYYIDWCGYCCLCDVNVVFNLVCLIVIDCVVLIIVVCVLLL